MSSSNLRAKIAIKEQVSSCLTLRQVGEAVGVHASTVRRKLRRNGSKRHNYRLASCRGLLRTAISFALFGDKLRL